MDSCSLQTHIQQIEFSCREGKEVHKLSAIRGLGDLFQSEGEDAIQKVLPAVQRALLEERSNLDLHCEAAIVFKGIIQNDKLCGRFPGLIDTMLQNVLENVTGQKDNFVTNGNGKYRLKVSAETQVHYRESRTSERVHPSFFV
ncbi:hypothetical protein ANCCAN_19960 [Ancylostoma caninum]|uniref:HEAT repeat protein n=1 Tax=Ancylostoma caninum TaxID=29170 RepID=A0A368FRS7_ANCCA|nr:hypothetical protein ANCCAN_19960 [Ancylostoma caninum]